MTFDTMVIITLFCSVPAGIFGGMYVLPRMLKQAKIEQIVLLCFAAAMLAGDITILCTPVHKLYLLPSLAVLAIAAWDAILGRRFSDAVYALLLFMAFFLTMIGIDQYSENIVKEFIIGLLTFYVALMMAGAAASRGALRIRRKGKEGDPGSDNDGDDGGPPPYNPTYPGLAKRWGGNLPVGGN